MDANVYFPFFPYFMGTIITTQSGFDAMGFQANYNSLIMKLSHEPSETDRAYMQKELTDIAAKTSNAQFVSYIESFENAKRVAKNILYLIITLLILFFSLSVIMINNAISARIRSGKQLIGTMRAVGATLKDVRKVFIWQLVYMIAAGIAVGVVFSFGLYGWGLRIDPYTSEQVGILTAVLCLIGYVAMLFTLCYLNIFRKTESYLERSIISNIREL